MLAFAAALLVQAMPTFAVAGDVQRGLVHTAARVSATAFAGFEAAVATDARRRCGGGELLFGKFIYAQQVSRGGAAGAVTSYRREIMCHPAPVSGVTPAEPDWAATPADDAAARAAAEALFAAYDRGDAEAVLALQDRAAILADTAERVAGWRTRAGRGRRVIGRVTWYVNPAAAPKPGVYVALDWHAEYDRLAVGCGYVVLYRRAGGYRVMREETNMLRKDQASTPDQLARARATLPCG